MKIEPNIQKSSAGAVGAEIAAGARSRFQRFGYAKTSMQEIADDCGMSAANLYRYFDGKLALAVVVAAAEQAAQLRKCDEAVHAARAEVAARLIALFHALIDTSRSQMKQAPLLFELSLNVARETPELRERFLTAVETRIVAILENETGKHGVTGSDGAIQHARLILTACATFVLPWMLQNVPFGDPRPKVTPLIHCLLSGMTVPQHLPA